MIGKTILHYKILSKLGEGGMGVVYKAKDTKLDREVAIKFLPRQIAAGSEERNRFKIEAKAAAALNHVNIATIHNIEEVNDETFIVMEYINGQELKDKVDSGPLPIDDTLNIAIQIASGLKAAHAKDVIHRDIKSSNIMLSDEGDAKIMDFGLAKRSGQTRLTKEGTTLGTVAYMSPEQARGDEVDQRSDIFSVGVLVYEMLTGQLPFKGDYEQAVTYSVMNEAPEPVTALRTGIPMELERIVNKCLEKNVSDRYPGADDLIVDLRKLKKTAQTQEIMSQSGIKPELPISKRPAYVLPAIVAIFVVVAIAGYWFMSDEPEVTQRVPIAVVDFVNETDEKELNGLSGMLITALEQSRHLDVMSRARMFDELKKMGREEVTFVDEATGREIAKQANVRALAVATIRKLGETYTIDFRVIEPGTGDRLYSAKEKGRGQDSVIGMIDRLSEKTRIDLKEESKTVQLAKTGIADVTTTNLEAYHHYFLGEQLMSSLDYRGAREEYQKAIALDTTFGLAYYRLANAFNWGFGAELAKEPLAKAFTLIDRIPEKERYLLRAVGANIEKGWAAAIPVAKEMELLYPDNKEMLYFIGDWSFHSRQNPQAVTYFEKVLAVDPTHEQTLYHLASAYDKTNQPEKYQSAIDRLMAVSPAAGLEVQGIHYAELGEYEEAIVYMNRSLESDSTWWNTYHLSALFYEAMGQFQKGLESANEWLKRNPVPVSYWRVAEAYILLGDLPNAQATIESGLQRFPDSWIRVILGGISALGGNLELAEAQFSETIAPAQPHAVRSLGYEQLAKFYMRKGQFSKMNEMFEGRIEMALSDSDNDTAAEMFARKAYWTFRAWRDESRVLQELQKAANLLNVTNEEYFFELAKTYALMGKTDRVKEALARVTDKTMKLDIESHGLMQRRDWDRALSVNKSIIERFWAEAQTARGYDNAVCYYEKGDFDQAVSDVVRAADFYGDDHEYVYPLSSLLLGKIYEKKGDTQLAIQNYEKFLKLWKDADEDLPDLIDAKARLAKLMGEG